MRKLTDTPLHINLFLVGIAVLLHVSFVAAQTGSQNFKISPSQVPAGRTRLVRITTETGNDLSDFELEAPPEDTGVFFDEQGPQFADGKKAIVVRLRIDEDADEQVIPLTIVKKEDGEVTERHTVDLTITEFHVRAIRKQAVPPNLEFAVDSMTQPLSYKATKDVFGRRVADAYYAVAVGLGNNTGFDLQINKIGFVTIIPIKVPELDENGNPVFDKKGNLQTKYQLMEVSAVDRPLVRSSIERDQSLGKRAFALNLIGSVGTLTTGFLPFFRALGPRANFSSFTSILNGQLRDGFTQAVPDFTIRHLNRLDNELVMDQDFVLPNNSEKNTVVFVPRNALPLGKEDTDDHKDHRDDLRMVTEKLGRLVVVGRQIDRFANRQIVVRSGVAGEVTRPGVISSAPTPLPTPAPPASPVTIESLSPDFGVLSEAQDVTITGTGFLTGSSVKVMFGDRQSPGVAMSATTIKTIVPPIATAGSIDVKVIVDATRQATKKNAYTYFDELLVQVIEPNTGTSAGGVAVKIRGRGFQSGAQVTFGDIAATEIQVSNDHNSITVTAPQHAAGAVTITVKNPNGKSFPFANGFTYLQPPAPPTP